MVCYPAHKEGICEEINYITHAYLFCPIAVEDHAPSSWRSMRASYHAGHMDGTERGSRRVSVRLYMAALSIYNIFVSRADDIVSTRSSSERDSFGNVPLVNIVVCIGA